ncbi:MAG: twin-arginine translocase TatA/TatE family subunit [Verrucomicrobiota bacterium]
MQHPVFAIGLPHGYEWLLILLLFVLFFGADKIPKLARGLGRSLGEFKKAKEDFEKEIHSAAAEADKKPEQPQIAGTPPAGTVPANTAQQANSATSIDELTKKS